MITRSDDLHILLTVVDAGGFSAAANVLDMQVAKVSRSVAKIETQLNTTLLNRTTRRVELTEEGLIFVERVRQGLYTLQEAEEELLYKGELPSGVLRVDAASPFVFHQLVPLVREFQQHYPAIQLQLTSNEGYVDLLEKRTDLAIRIGKLQDSSLYARPLGKSPLHLVASPEYLAKRGVPAHVADLNGHDLLGFSDNRVLNRWPLKGLKEIEPSITASSGETLRLLALAGNGIACMSAFMIRDDVAHGRLVSVLSKHKIAGTEREQVNAVFYKASSLSKRIAVFIEFIQPRLQLGL
ncbi:LysR family transcriptional regulator [Thalassotalea sp. HSM 43]|uniref:LysR family transcriptional regulator n=1 Tax=Thalassotalea sp. HSM 43 TaxID=2552945 RepID=UPI001080C288|nr:LysR family transcriptional regulator [Thalassotalea sp. HSM 43]QBY03518.1 LysR family transcriptional regulator [Thalassotalea sp. HSM 43]